MDASLYRSDVNQRLLNLSRSTMLFVPHGPMISPFFARTRTSAILSYIEHMAIQPPEIMKKLRSKIIFHLVGKSTGFYYWQPSQSDAAILRGVFWM